MRTSRRPPGYFVESLDRPVRRSVTPIQIFVLMVVAVLVAACTDSPEPDDNNVVVTASAASRATATTAVTPPAVDVGVDLESAVIRLGLVGEISDDLWAGHFAYWDSVDTELGGVGGRYQVELVLVDSIREAAAVGALAVSIDAGGDSRVVLDMLVADPYGGEQIAKRLPDLVLASMSESLDAAFVSIETTPAPIVGGLSIDSESAVMVVHAESSCPSTLATATVDQVGVGEIPDYESPVLFFLCVPSSAVLSTAAEALTASPGSVLVIPAAAWRPGLAGQLEGSAVVVAGYIPEPGADRAPASDVMALILGDGPWSGEEIDGYTSALSMHAVLEAALIEGDLTRSAVLDIAAEVDKRDLGFGTADLPVGVLDGTSPTGLRTVAWAGAEILVD